VGHLHLSQAVHLLPGAEIPFQLYKQPADQFPTLGEHRLHCLAH